MVTALPDSASQVAAPTKFSAEFLDWIKQNDRDAELKEDSIAFEGVRIWLKASLLVITTGGMMDIHVQDVIDGFTDESLSQVERFTKWSAKAKGDIVLFADMKAWRMAVDRLGEEFDDNFRRTMDVVEWQKWDMITGTVALPAAPSKRCWASSVRAAAWSLLTRSMPYTRAAAPNRTLPLAAALFSSSSRRSALGSPPGLVTSARR